MWISREDFTVGALLAVILFVVMGGAAYTIHRAEQTHELVARSACVQRPWLDMANGC